MKLAIVGPSRSGKDESGLILDRISTLRYTGFCTSMVILPHASKRLGMPERIAWDTRHRHRALWREIGDELREHDPAFLARQVLAGQDIAVGIRSRREMLATQEQGLVDLTVWVDRDVPKDESQEFGQELCDIVVPNHWGVEELESRLTRLAASWGVLKPPVDCAAREPNWAAVRALA